MAKLSARGRTLIAQFTKQMRTHMITYRVMSDGFVVVKNGKGMAWKFHDRIQGFLSLDEKGKKDAAEKWWRESKGL